MKKLLAAAVLVIATSVFAQQPPLPSCVTNVYYTLTDTNAWFDATGGSVTNSSGSLTVVIDYHGCSTNPIVIGNIFLQCDVQRHCQNNENIWNCPSGNVIPIVMPALCNGITATFEPNGGCCEFHQVNSNPQTCAPADGSCGGPQP